MKLTVTELDSFERGAEHRHKLKEFQLTRKSEHFTSLQLKKESTALSWGSTLEVEASYSPENGAFCLFVSLEGERVLNSGFQYFGLPAVFELRFGKTILGFAIQE